MDSVVLNERIAFNLATEFEQYLMGIRQDESVTPNKVIRKAQDKGIVRCMNKGFVDKRRKEIVEAFERRSTKEFEMRVIEEKSFDFKYPFNQYYKGNTTVRIVAL